MKRLQLLLVIIIFLRLCHCEVANSRQKKLIEGSVNLKADPCDDFYEYACGDWFQVNQGAGSEYFHTLSMFDYNVNKEMSQAFNDFTAENKPKFIKQAYMYYKSCKSLESYKPFEYLAWLKANDSFFKWPALWTQPHNNTVFNWVETLARMRTYGLNNVFIQLIVMPKADNANVMIIDLDKPEADGSFQPLTKENFETLMLPLPAEITIEDFDHFWQEIEGFEQNLQQLDSIKDPLVDNELDYEKERLFYVKNLPLDWLKDYVRIVLNQTEINNEMQLYIQNIPYMKALDKLLKQHSQRFLCKYLEVRFLSKLYVNPTEETCLASVRSLMPLAMHWQYEQYHFELLEEYSSLYRIFNDVRKHFNSTVIKNRHGFNATVVQYLQNKINHMKFRLNNIPRIDTVETLEKFYKNLSLHTEKFYENDLKLTRFNFLASLDLLNKDTPILDYIYLESEKTGSSSSPYFNMDSNTIIVPLTFIQHPMYSPGLDDIYTYSSMGFTLAHEMFHGFDYHGVYADAYGSINSIQFKDNPLFNDSLNCLLEIDPIVIDEKIADVSGLGYAYQAFFDSQREINNKTVSLCGNEISLRKLFFLNFAQFFCGKSAEEHISTYEHGSDRDRITDALSQFPEFAEEFKCNSSHQLYPHEVCHLWHCVRNYL